MVVLRLTMNMTDNPTTINTLISILSGGDTEHLVEFLVSEVLKENASFNFWCSHPERIYSAGRIRKIKGGYMIVGEASYRDSVEKMRILLEESGEVKDLKRKESILRDE